MVGQIEMIDYLRGQDPEKPRLNIGQEIYIRELDTVRKAVVTVTYPVEDEDQHGYCIRFGDGGRGATWDEKIGKTTFMDEESALAAILKLPYDKFDPTQADFSDSVSYEYIRELDGHRLKAVLAKAGDLMLYEKDFYCYHFLNKYPTRKARDRRYTEMLAKIKGECQEKNGTETTPEFETLYKVGDVYAERGYAVNHL